LLKAKAKEKLTKNHRNGNCRSKRQRANRRGPKRQRGGGVKEGDMEQGWGGFPGSRRNHAKSVQEIWGL